MIVDYLAFFCSVYGVEDSYDFLESRKHWGEKRVNTEIDLKKSFYKLRINTSEYMLGRKQLKIKDLYTLATIEESTEDLIEQTK